MTSPQPRDPLWWQDHTACQGLKRDLFMAASGNRTKTAKAICKRCPSEQICLFFGMSLEAPSLRFGIFGAMGPEQREALHVVPEIAHALYLDERALLWETLHSSEILVELRSLNR